MGRLIKVDYGSVGGGGVENATLLWTNPNPTSNFSAQTLALDLTNYGAILVEARFSTSGANKSIVYISKGSVDGQNERLVRCYASTNQRSLIVNDSGVTFDAANGAANCIPTRIWGVSTNIISDQ